MLYAMKWRLAKWLLFVSCSMCLTLNVKGQKGCEEPHSPTPWNVTGKMHDTPQLIGLLFYRCLLEVGSLFPTKRMTLWMLPKLTFYANLLRRNVSEKVNNSSISLKKVFWLQWQKWAYPILSLMCFSFSWCLFLYTLVFSFSLSSSVERLVEGGSY